MNNCRAGLYSFASTTTWLHEIGMASPPFLVMLGLTLPDSRILNGIASIGLTLANIAIILPHLRQPILDSMHANECALADQRHTQEQRKSSARSNSMQLVDLNVECPSLALVSPGDRGHQNLPLACSATVKSVISAVTERSKSLDVGSEVAPHTILPLSAGKADDDQVPPKICHSPDADSVEMHINSAHLLAWEGRVPLHIPLPVPDAAEVAFFDMTQVTLSNRDLGEECPMAPCAQHAGPEENFVTEINRPIAGKGIEQEVVTADLVDTPTCVGIHEEREKLTLVRISQGQSRPYRTIVKPSEAGQPVTDENTVPTPTQAESTVLRLPDGFAVRGGTTQSGQPGYSLAEGKETLTKRRPESLVFIPQSVIRRYPSAPIASTGRCFGYRAFSSRRDHQVIPTSPHILIHNPAILLDGTRPRANYATLEGSWCAPFLNEVHSRRQSTGAQTSVIKTGPALDSPIVHEQTALRRHPRRQFGVPARIALRNCRYTMRTRRCRNDTNDSSSSSDGDSELDSDSQYSSGSSADETMLPHMLGADLLAAIDANSESELNLVESRRTTRTPGVKGPFDAYEDSLVSDNSAADISMAMHVSSNDDATDSEVRVPASFRPITHEDIQQWASGVVQKCAMQDCHRRAVVEPLSPSQVSDICAERPSGSGISQCPLSGLHCRLGAAALAEAAAPKTKELPVSLPPTFILPNRKPLSIRNMRDIPEFVPRCVSGIRRRGTRSTVDATTEVIARVESQAGFNARQRLMGMDEKRMVGPAGGWRSTQRRA